MKLLFNLVIVAMSAAVCSAVPVTMTELHQALNQMAAGAQMAGAQMATGAQMAANAQMMVGAQMAPGAQNMLFSSQSQANLDNVMAQFGNNVADATMALQAQVDQFDVKIKEIETLEDVLSEKSDAADKAGRKAEAKALYNQMASLEKLEEQYDTMSEKLQTLSELITEKHSDAKDKYADVLEQLKKTAALEAQIPLPIINSPPVAVVTTPVMQAETPAVTVHTPLHTAGPKPQSYIDNLIQALLAELGTGIV